MIMLCKVKEEETHCELAACIWELKGKWVMKCKTVKDVVGMMAIK